MKGKRMDDKGNKLYYENHDLVFDETPERSEERKKLVESINDEMEKLIQKVVPDYKMQDKSSRPHFPMITLHVDVRPGKRRAPPPSIQHWIPNKEYSFSVKFQDISLNHSNKTHNIYAVGGGMYEVKVKKEMVKTLD